MKADPNVTSLLEAAEHELRALTNGSHADVRVTLALDLVTEAMEALGSGSSPRAEGRK
jgi:hypothetical protein